MCLKNAVILVMSRWWVGWLERQKFLYGSQLEICRWRQHFGVIKSLNVQLSVTKLFGRCARTKPFFHLATNISAWHALIITATLSRTRFFVKQRQKSFFLAIAKGVLEWIAEWKYRKDHDPLGTLVRHITQATRPSFIISWYFMMQRKQDRNLNDKVHPKPDKNGSAAGKIFWHWHLGQSFDLNTT